jgi:glucose-6-phosphate isomerase
MQISRQQWQLLRECNRRLKGFSISDHFNTDSERASRCRVEAAGLLLDYSRHRLDEQAFDQLFDLARLSELGQGIQDLVTGELLNRSEQRAALHTALRSDLAASGRGQEAHQTATAMLEQMQALADKIHQGRWLGASGEQITDLVNIGIGGSDLGPRLAVEALEPYRNPDLRCHFLSNVDASALDALLARLDPEKTLFCVTTKSFATRETLTNALAAREWLESAPGLGGGNLDAHFLAVTARPDRAAEWGVAENHILPMWDWVGGRFSLWSAVGLPIAATIGMANFQLLLEGARSMDQHFLEAEPRQNMPVVLALLGAWYRNVCDIGSYAVVCYDQRLQHFPDYLQQLDMESNGKAVTACGEPLESATAPVCWGGVGTNAQHAFFQWLHQSPDRVPVDLIGVREPHHDRPDHHRQLLANLVGQSNALMEGRSLLETREVLRSLDLPAARVEELAPHCTFPGNQPSTILLLESLTPTHLGSMLALYEHKTFVQGWLWGINSFDQWGVELGKVLAEEMEVCLAEGTVGAEQDDSTRYLVEWLARRGKPNR